MLRIGLTGGIACGKSLVAKMLVKRGAHFLQADSLAHRLYEPGTVTYKEIVRHFGRGILGDDGSIDRSRLANIVFAGRIAELNAIVHPAVLDAQMQWMAEVERKNPDGIAVVEAALIIEAGAAKDFDKIIVVTCDFEHKVERYARRTGTSLEAARAEVERRSAAQLSDEEKASHADYLIDNSGGIEATEVQVERIWSDLRTQPGGPSAGSVRSK
jgi:dephospho-CoA kinase